jgi:GNAT superfamily N-acetyltransferase
MDSAFLTRMATANEDFAAAESLFRQYASELGFDLEFQDFEEELESLQSQYGYPEGGIVLLVKGDRVVGCAGIRRLSEEEAELKRMFVKTAYRGKGGGRLLLEAAIGLARDLGYGLIKLDTIETMAPAIALYTKYGFVEVEPYRFNPMKGAQFFELKLD